MRLTTTTTLWLSLAMGSSNVEAWAPRTLTKKLVSRPIVKEDHEIPSLQRPLPWTRREPTKFDWALFAEAVNMNQKDLKLNLFNGKTREKQAFTKSKSDEVSMYTCGPTVYDFAHVGNFRAFVTYDILKRVLLYLGFSVKHICNITDVDDKIIQKATQEKIAIGEIQKLTLKYEKEFLQDLKILNCIAATEYPRATEHMNAMFLMIQQLAEAALAYETSDGSWYFDTQRQEGRYGKQLINLNFEDLQEQKVTENADGKRHFADFCLWKAFKDGIDRDDAAWEYSTTEENIKIQKGRPGWHLECSAMARHYFGDVTLDFHGGGEDLKFPHHENEIAQSEGVYNRAYYKSTKDSLAPLIDAQNDDINYMSFCDCWFHNGFVNIGDEKMSKSLGNFLTLRQACPTAADVRAYRYLVVSSQYRNPLTFTDQVMKASKKSIQRMDKVKSEIEQALKEYKEEGSPEPEDSFSELAKLTVPAALANFEAAIVDDLSMPRAAAALFTLVKAAEQEFKRVKKDEDGEEELDLIGLKAILKAMKQMDQVFGIFYEVPVTEGIEDNTVNGNDALEVPKDVLDLVAQRSAAKEAKDWELADSLRSRITELGFAVKDVKGGDPVISKVEQ